MEMIWLWSGFNFIILLCATSMCEDSESAKSTVKLSVFYVLSGFALVKGAHKMLMKLTTGYLVQQSPSMRIQTKTFNQSVFHGPEMNS